MFWWAYLAVRLCGADAMTNATTTGDWSAPCFTDAGTKLNELLAKEPFQEGFLAAVWDGAGGQAATMAVGDAAMMLMGQWAPGTMQANTADKQPVTFDLDWFPFPGIDGGAGAPTDGFGGGNGFAVGKDAPPEAIEFLKYISTKENADRWGALNTGTLPVTIGAETSVTDPNLTSVLDARGKADYVQLYLDQATTPELGAVINDAVATLFAFVTVRLRTRQVMLPLLVLPLLVPLVIAAVKATEAALGPGLGAARDALGVLVSFDVIFVTAGLLLFPAIVRD